MKQLILLKEFLLCGITNPFLVLPITFLINLYYFNVDLPSHPSHIWKTWIIGLYLLFRSFLKRFDDYIKKRPPKQKKEIILVIGLFYIVTPIVMAEVISPMVTPKDCLIPSEFFQYWMPIITSYIISQIILIIKCRKSSRYKWIFD